MSSDDGARRQGENKGGARFIYPELDHAPKSEKSMLSIKERIRRFLWKPGAVQLLIAMLSLLSHIRNVNAFRKALRESGWEEAMEYTDLPKDEFLNRVEHIRKGSQQLAEAVSMTTKRRVEIK